MFPIGRLFSTCLDKFSFFNLFKNTSEIYHAYHEICAVYDCDSIKVYQAYNPHIAQLAIQHQKFVSPSLFKE
ncbi:DUF4291 family protein [Acinetobacter bereziniae]|uniref:DUF4291 family protein n=1 Tax=Acinetobacter bereziniae TaxID=106648 RepID=UPI001D0F1B4E|nr:DUF4291 family protein [Acinetobacter bereziniae]